uniref:Uncharacterized protein n=1 Tax=Cannabis sativa TaxID=3483 RepID=A0A803PQ07_CANSA
MVEVNTNHLPSSSQIKASFFLILVLIPMNKMSATFTINRLPTPVLNYFTPYECLFGKKPDYTILRSFAISIAPNHTIIPDAPIPNRTIQPNLVTTTAATLPAAPDVVTLDQPQQQNVAPNSPFPTPDPLPQSSTHPPITQPSTNSPPLPIPATVSSSIPQENTTRTHHMQTRSRSGIVKPKAYLATKHPLPEFLLPTEPTSLKKALQHPK